MVSDYLDSNREEWEALASASPSDAADVIEQLPEEDAAELLAELDPEDAAEVLEEIAPELAAELIEQVPLANLAAALATEPRSQEIEYRFADQPTEAPALKRLGKPRLDGIVSGADEHRAERRCAERNHGGVAQLARAADS